MKQIIISTLLIIFSAINTFAQTDFFIKIYHNTDFVKRVDRDYDGSVKDYVRTENYHTLFNRISIAGTLIAERWAHELEVSYTNDIPPLEHEFRNSEELDLKSSYYSLQYEISKMFNPKDKQLQFSAGLGLNNYWNKMNHEASIIISEYPFYERNIGTTLTLIPRIGYRLLPRLWFDLNIKFGILDIRQYVYYIDNLGIPKKQRFKEKGIHSDFLPSAYNLRFGLSYKIK